MISTTGEYALRASLFLARHEGQARTVAVIAVATKVPCGYLAKVLGDLVSRSLVVSRRGIGGGYCLARPATAITVLDVLEAVGSAPRRYEECPLGLEDHGELCPLHRLLDDAVAAVRTVLGSVSLHKLAPTDPDALVICGLSEVVGRLADLVPAPESCRGRRTPRRPRRSRTA